MKLEWDFSEFGRFATEISDAHNYNSAMMTATQNVARVLHKYLTALTPVDTGNLRKMWSAGDNLKFTVEPINDGFQVTFINTARANTKDGFMYGVAVNDGHRKVGGKGWVMGRFFVEKSIQISLYQVEQIVMRELEKWWEGCF